MPESLREITPYGAVSSDGSGIFFSFEPRPFLSIPAIYDAG